MTQTVTPELKAWIIEQAQAGFPAEQVLQSMKASGWHEDVAIGAMESTLTEHLRATGHPVPGGVATQVTGQLAAGGATAVVSARADTTAVASAATKPMPEPDIAGEPLTLDLGDRVVPVLLAMKLPRVVVLGNLLSDEECDTLVEAARGRLARSRTVSTKTGGEEINPDRTSQGMFYQRGENDLVRRIEARLARLTRWPEENGEGLQILNYAPGAEYKPHYDYFDPKEPGTPNILKRGGQRVGTVVMYLNDTAAGGGTIFPDVGLTVSPKKGNAVFFSYTEPAPGTKTLHGGAPVIAGEKWIATKWLREGVFI